MAESRKPNAVGVGYGWSLWVLMDRSLVFPMVLLGCDVLFLVFHEYPKVWCYCRWTKSISHHFEPWLKPVLVGIFAGGSSFRDFLGGAKWISSIHSMYFFGFYGCPKVSLASVVFCLVCPDSCSLWCLVYFADMGSQVSNLFFFFVFFSYGVHLEFSLQHPWVSMVFCFP